MPVRDSRLNLENLTMLARRLVMLCLAAASVTACPSTLSAQESGKTDAAASGAVSLKPKLVKGETHKFKWHAERTMSFDAMQQTGVDKSVVDADVSLTVADVNEAGYALDIVVDSIKIENESRDSKLAWDSSKPEDDKDRDNEAYQAFKPLVGMKLTLNADKNGVITGVSGEPATPQGRRLQELARQLFITPEYLKFRWNMILNARRDGADSKVGDSWSHTDTFVAPQVGKFDHMVTSTLKSVNDGVASVDAVGEMKLSPAKEGAPMAFELKDTSILATSTWDVSDGLSRSFEMQRAFTLDGTAQGMPVKRKVEEKLTVTRSK